AVLWFWGARMSRSALEPGILSAQMDKRVALWNSKKVPAAGRIVNIVISDAETVALAAMTLPPSSRLSAWDSQALTLADQPSPWKETKVLFKRTFLRRSMSAAEDTPFVKAFSDDPDAIVWTHEGFATASVDEMSREIAKAIVKANGAGAQVNLITQGISAVPALKALNALKNQAFGSSAKVNKFAAVDMNAPTLQRFAPDYFKKNIRPENLREWAGVWTSGSSPKTAIIELFSPNCDGTRFSCSEVFAMMGMQSEVSAQDVIWLVKNLIKKDFAMEQVPLYLAEAAQAKATAKAQAEAEVRKVTANAAAKKLKAAFNKEKAAKASGEPEDSLSAINAGWLTKEREAANKAEGVSADMPAGQGSSSARTGWERYDKECGKCCVDAGGSWDNREKRHCCAGADYDYEVPSCRVIWVDKGGRSHNCAYRLGCKRP
ncbi:MAG: hypothetical protein KKH28_03010, partial [Elusimicrobia bacterium]|nr:hypothetical protein [Elusimicrobiota bacterium]